MAQAHPFTEQKGSTQGRHVPLTHTRLFPILEGEVCVSTEVGLQFGCRAAAGRFSAAQHLTGAWSSALPEAGHAGCSHLLPATVLLLLGLQKYLTCARAKTLP